MLESNNYPYRKVLTSGTQAISIDYFIENSHIRVEFFPASGSASFIGTVGTDYSLASAGIEDGGTCTMIGKAAGDVVVISRDMPFTQDLNLPEKGKLNESDVEQRLDELTMNDQQLKGDVDLSLKMPNSEAPSEANTRLPATSTGGVPVYVPGSGWSFQTITTDNALSGVTTLLYTATEGQTVFTTPAYVQGLNLLHVQVNNMPLNYADFTETSTTSVTLDYEASEGDLVQVTVFAVGSVAAATLGINVSSSPSGTGAVPRSVDLRINDRPVTPEDFGATGNGVSDDAAALQLFFEHLSTTGEEGYLPGRTYACSTAVSLSQAGPVRVSGTGTIKASGSARQYLLRITDITFPVSIDGITIDGNDLVSRPLTLESSNVSADDLSDVSLGGGFSSINAKETDTYTGGYNVYILGGFRKIYWDGKTDGATSSRSSGSCVTTGVEIAFDTGGGADDYPRQIAVGPNSRILNVSNNNSPAADADGFKVRVDTDQLDSTLTVAPGAYFENCQGRCIKSQAQNNSVIGAVTLRNAFDGVAEIDIQRAGGIVSGCVMIQDGYTTPSAVIGTVRDAASVSTNHLSFTDNTLRVIGSPSTQGEQFALVTGSDSTAVIEGLSFSGNKVQGVLDHFASIRVANFANNMATFRDNWIQEATSSFIDLWRQGSGSVYCKIVAEGNSSSVACTGIVFAASTESYILKWEGNYNISTPNIQIRAGAGAIALDKQYHDIRSDGVDALTLADGVEGEEKWLYMTVDVSDAVLTPTSLLGGTTITFDDVGDTAHLRFTGGKWVLMGGTATLA